MGASLHSNKQEAISVVQFGEGNFLRAFVDWMLQKLKNQGFFFGDVHVVQPIAEGRCDALARSENGYHVVLQGFVNDVDALSIDHVDVISSWQNPYEGREVLDKLARAPENVVVISNTTEAGITFDPECRIEDDPPSGFPAKLTKFLFQRFELHAERDVYILPCELIDRNGDELKKAVHKYCDLWMLHGEFKPWLDTKVHFYNTLVDRIVSGYPRSSAQPEIAELMQRDKNLVVAEPYHLWVLEGSDKLEQILPFRKAELNVVYTDRLQAYREAKVRILNGLHSALVPIGLSAGLTYVNECFEHLIIKKYLEAMLRLEIIPSLDADFSEAYLETYSERILQRLRNPHLMHKLSDISLNSLSKIQTRLFPTIEIFRDAYGFSPSLTTHAVAALFYAYAVLPPGFEINEADSNTRSLIQNARIVYENEASWEEYLEAFLNNNLIQNQFIGLFKKLIPELADMMAHFSKSGLTNSFEHLIAQPHKF